MIALSFPAWDTQLFVLLNGLHADWLDPVMRAFSSSTFWIPLYLVLAFFMVRSRQWMGACAILFIGLGFGIADQLSVIMFKDVFQRLRPCHEASLQSIIHSIENCGGQYGFVSNHAANTFCLATFISLFFQKRALSISIFVWAAAVSYSRIYVGKHYPLDIICGAMFGMLCGLFAYLLFRKACPSIETFISKYRGKREV